MEISSGFVLFDSDFDIWMGGVGGQGVGLCVSVGPEHLFSVF